MGDRTAAEEIANDGTKWVFINFCSEERGRRATSNVLTEQSILSRWSRQVSHSASGTFELLLDNYIVFLIQNCTMVEAQKVFRNEN